MKNVMEDLVIGMIWLVCVLAGAALLVDLFSVQCSEVNFNKGDNMNKCLILLVSLLVVGCGTATDSPAVGGSGGGGGGGGAYCSVGYCYSYLEQVCCPKSAPYACNNACYTYSGGGGCSSYKTQCY